MTDDKIEPLIVKLENAGVKFDEKYENFFQITKSILLFIDNFDKIGTNFDLYAQIVKSRYNITNDDVNRILNTYKEIPNIQNEYFNKLNELDYCKQSVVKYFDELIIKNPSYSNKKTSVNNKQQIDTALDEILDAMGDTNKSDDNLSDNIQDNSFISGENISNKV